MPSGSRPILRFPRAASLLLALAFVCRAAQAQEVEAPSNSQEDLGLRAGGELVPPDLEPPYGQTADEAAKAAADKAKLARNKAKLPPLQPYRGAERLGLRGGAAELDPAKAGVPGEAPAPGPTVAAIPAPPLRRKIPPDDKPYEPLGVRIGDLELRPYFEQDVGWSSNPAFASGPLKGSGFETSEIGASLKSDWSRDDLHADLKGGYTDYFTAPQSSGPYGSGTLGGRYDVSRDLSFDAEGRFSVIQEPLSSLGLVSASTGGASPNTTVSTYGATIGGAQKFGDLTLALHGTYDRTAYEDVSLGGVGNLALDDYNDWGLRARASYRVSEAVSPFVEFGVDTRRYDSQTDANGYARDSNGALGRIGATLAFSQMLTGEASVGYGERTYQDPRLPKADAPLVDGSLIWSATPLTTVTVKAQSALADSVLAGASADITRNFTIEVSHALTRAITLGVTAGYATDHYVGVADQDSTKTFGLKGEYHLSREVVLKASASRQQYISSVPGSNYSADVLMLGLRLQP